MPEGGGGGGVGRGGGFRGGEVVSRRKWGEHVVGCQSNKERTHAEDPTSRFLMKFGMNCERIRYLSSSSTNTSKTLAM